MISNKFAVGRRYRLENCSGFKNGIIEVTEINSLELIGENTIEIRFKIIEGLGDWDMKRHYFHEGSFFSDCLSHIEEGETN